MAGSGSESGAESVVLGTGSRIRIRFGAKYLGSGTLIQRDYIFKVAI
jgi:hypothetical protein